MSQPNQNQPSQEQNRPGQQKPNTGGDRNNPSKEGNQGGSQYRPDSSKDRFGREQSEKHPDSGMGQQSGAKQGVGQKNDQSCNTGSQSCSDNPQSRGKSSPKE